MNYEIGGRTRWTVPNFVFFSVFFFIFGFVGALASSPHPRWPFAVRNVRAAFNIWFAFYFPGVSAPPFGILCKLNRLRSENSWPTTISFRYEKQHFSLVHKYLYGPEGGLVERPFQFWVRSTNFFCFFSSHVHIARTVLYLLLSVAILPPTPDTDCIPMLALRSPFGYVCGFSFYALAVIYFSLCSYSNWAELGGGRRRGRGRSLHKQAIIHSYRCRME